MEPKIDKLKLTGRSDINQRRKLDFYPTPPEATIALMNFLNLKPCTIWEPACGEMHMANVIKDYGHNVISTDILTGDDYLNTQKQVDCIITNPPFCLADQFILKAINEANLVAMLLKSQYWHAKKRFNLYNDNLPAYILPLTWRPDFMFKEKGGSPTMEVCWTVWIKGNNQCKYIPLEKP